MLGYVWDHTKQFAYPCHVGGKNLQIYNSTLYVLLLSDLQDSVGLTMKVILILMVWLSCLDSHEGLTP